MGFGRGIDRRAARTVNHRMAAVAAFYGFLIERDSQSRNGVWPGSRTRFETRLGAEARDAGLGLAVQRTAEGSRDVVPGAPEQVAVEQVQARDRAT